MKIAIPTRNKIVDDHFGHCEYYTIVSVSSENKIEKVEDYQAPQGCGCKSNIASILAKMGVNIMLAGNMGQGAVNKLTNAGIRVVRGCSGDVVELAESYLRTPIIDSGINCHQKGHGQHGHVCGH